MQGEDCEHYVVLDYGHQMTSQGITNLPSILEEREMADMQYLGEDMQHQQPVSQKEIRMKKEQERANSFGFDNDDDSD